MEQEFLTISLPITVPRSLLCGGVPREELHVYTPRGLVIWYPDGSVRAPLSTDIYDAMQNGGLVSFVSLIPR